MPDQGQLNGAKFALAYGSRKATVHHGREATVAGMCACHVLLLLQSGSREAELNQEMGLSRRLQGRPTIAQLLQ